MMDISNIPKTFWHALSLSVVLLTGGFLVLAYQSASVSIEMANTKITLYQAAEEAKAISNEIEREYEQLEELQNQIQNIMSSLRENRSLQMESDETRFLQRELELQGQMLAEPRTRRNIEELNSRIQSVQESLQKVQ